MGSSPAFTHTFSSSSSSLGKLVSNPSHHTPKFSLQEQNFRLLKTGGNLLIKQTNHHLFNAPIVLTRATLDEKEQIISTPVAKQQPSEVVTWSVEVLKDSAKTRKVPAEEILSALFVLEKAKLDPSGFLDSWWIKVPWKNLDAHSHS